MLYPKGMMIADLLTLLFADSHDEPTFIGGVAVAI